MKTKGYVRVEALKSYTEHLGAGLVASSGDQFTTAVPFGTTAIAMLDKLIDPGFSMTLKEIKAHLEYRFVNLLDAVGSLTYYWQVRPEYVNPVGTKVTGTYINIAGNYTSGVGSLATITGTLTGYIPVGSVPGAPIRVRLMASGLVPSTMTGAVKASSYIQVDGVVIP